jgi:hypothetical protein
MSEGFLTMMTRFMLCAAVCLIFLPLSAQAKDACYTKADAEAEQAIRIHTELMNIALNCQTSRFAQGQDNIYATYRQFTSDHGAQLAAYDIQMISYFKRAGSKYPEGDLNTLHTNFANNIALDAAKMRPDMFCYTYVPRIEKIKNMSNEQFRQWAQTSYQGHPTTHPMCP